MGDGPSHGVVGGDGPDWVLPVASEVVPGVVLRAGALAEPDASVLVDDSGGSAGGSVLAVASVGGGLDTLSLAQLNARMETLRGNFASVVAQLNAEIARRWELEVTLRAAGVLSG